MTVAQAQALAGAHRVVQARLGAELAAVAVRLWEALDLDDLDGPSLERWLVAVERLVEGKRAQSEAVARRFLARHRVLAGVDAPMPDVDGDVLDLRAVRTSLLVTGPYRFRSNMARGLTPGRASEMAAADSAGAALRHALAGGRSLIDTTVNTDPAIVGVQRRSSGSPCAFCAMLVSRGPVYKSEQSASFEPHDRCGCQPDPVYRDRAPLTPQALVEREKWERAKRMAGDEGVATAVMFRRIHEGRA